MNPSLPHTLRSLATIAALTLLSGLALAPVTLTPAEASGSREVRVGSLKFEHMEIGETRPGQPAAGAFVEIENKGRSGDRLVGLTLDKAVAARGEIHTMSMDGGTMTMRQIPGLDIPADGKARLAPGGNHLMLIGLPQPLTAGQTVSLTLQFEKAGAVPLQFVVVPRDKLRREGSSKHHH